MSVTGIGGLPINKRSFRTFLSHAHVDKHFTDKLYDWCRDFLAIKVWYDSTDFTRGLVGSELGRAIEDCQSAIIVLSEKSISSGWVEEEWNICLDQRTKFPDFQIVPLKIDDCQPPAAALRARKWLDVENGTLSSGNACQIIEALHWHQTEPSSMSRESFYLSRGSRAHEVKESDALIGRLKAMGYRFVRDSPDRFSFQESRIKAIMKSTNGVVAFVSNRGSGTTSDYILKEIRFARELGLPMFVVYSEGLSLDVLQFFADCQKICMVDADIEEQLAEFLDSSPAPIRGAHCFLAHDFDGAGKHDWLLAKRVVEAVSGFPCITGDGLTGDAAQQQIVDQISHSAYAIFDISDDRLNTCIEAGIARGAGAKFDLICCGPRRSPPFAFRDKQVFFYETPVERLGLMHKLTYDIRRVLI